MIPKLHFGSTGHLSTRTIFGAFALSEADEKLTEQVMDTVLDFGINHIDTAASYGNSERMLGPWLKQHRSKVFLATKTEKRTYNEAKEELHRSLELLQTDYVDLWQMHNLINPEQWNKALSEGGAIEAFVEAKEQGLVKNLGVTGHGLAAPERHLQSINKFSFDSILVPFNYILMQNTAYANAFNKLYNACQERNIAFQTIKSLAIKTLGNEKAQHNVWYKPLNNQADIDKAVSWVLSHENVFLNTSGDYNLLKMILKSANDLGSKPSANEMQEMVKNNNMEPLFKGGEI